MFAAEQKRPVLARFRARWQAYQGRIDPRRLVFLDETWIKTNMAPLRGWGPRCKRLLAYVHGMCKWNPDGVACCICEASSSKATPSGRRLALGGVHELYRDLDGEMLTITKLHIPATWACSLPDGKCVVGDLKTVMETVEDIMSSRGSTKSSAP